MTFANLDCTDATEIDGARVEQRQELLDVHFPDGSRALVHRDHLGAVVLRGEAQGHHFELVLPAVAAIRLGSHLAALGAETLDPSEEIDAA